MSEPATGDPIRFNLNGEEREISPHTTVAALVDQAAAAARWVAVERNGEIVPRQRWAAVSLVDGDRIEIVRFVQGG